MKPKFKRGQIVVQHFKDSTKLGHGDPIRIGWVEKFEHGFVYRKARWASWGYAEKELRSQTKRERGPWAGRKYHEFTK